MGGINFKNDMKIALDFDGVICNLKGIYRVHDISKSLPHKYSQDAIRWLLEEGHEVWICTSRDEDEWGTLALWLKGWGFPRLEITNRKKEANIYLDDRAVRFTNWMDFCKLLG